MRLFLLLLIPVLFVAPLAKSQTIAFPGAEGFGKYATGGRAGRVLVVTSLADDGPGSLRKAIQSKSPRIIVFAVAGNIELASPLDINHGDVTIAGQSAPGDGICIKNYTVNVKSDNVIIRFLRFRLGDEKGYEGDALAGTKGKHNIMIDHCSMSWSTDECASFYHNTGLTLQWCIISESLNNSIHSKGPHGYGGIWGGRNASFHHNLIASHSSRLPRFSGSESTRNDADELVDFRNNVIYNWMSNNVYGGERGRYNIVNNYFKPGPATKATRRGQILNPWAPYGKFFVQGNIVYGDESVTQENTLGLRAEDVDSALAPTEFTTESVSMQNAVEACELVLRYAGASFKRDGVDERIVDEVRAGNSSHGKERNGIIDSQEDVGGWPVLRSAEPHADMDRDGMPDAWERKHGLNPKDASDACRRTVHDDYDNVEVYLNGLVDALIIQ